MLLYTYLNLKYQLVAAHIISNLITPLRQNYANINNAYPVFKTHCWDSITMWLSHPETLNSYTDTTTYFMSNAHLRVAQREG